MKKRKTVNQALGLPSSYHSRLHIEGWIEKDHWEIKVLTSTTGGQVTVWAASKSWGEWEEINSTWFEVLAKGMVFPPKPYK